MAPKQFTTNVFDRNAQALFLPKQLAAHLEQVRTAQAAFHVSDADAIADGMKTWAMQAGATHYAIWLHPPFSCLQQVQYTIEQLRGQDLLFTDLRLSPQNTGSLLHKFNGYAAWSSASSPFLWEEDGRRILCLPSLCYSSTGMALDCQAPLLRADAAIRSVKKRLLLLCNTQDRAVAPVLRVELRYSLNKPQLDSFSEEVQRAALSLGITIGYAESVLPSEIAMHWSAQDAEPQMQHARTIALSADQPAVTCAHCLLLTQIMQQVAKRRELICLQQQQTYFWSLHLLEPHVFLIVMTAICRAMHEHQALLRASMAPEGGEAFKMSTVLSHALQTIVRQIVQQESFDAAFVQRLDLALRNLSMEDRVVANFAALGQGMAELPLAILQGIIADSLHLILDEIDNALQDQPNLEPIQCLEKTLPILRKYLQQNNLDHSDHHSFLQPVERKSICALEAVLTEQEIEYHLEGLAEQYASKMSEEARAVIQMYQNLSEREMVMIVEEIKRLEMETQGLGWAAKAKVLCELSLPKIEQLKSWSAL